MSADVLRKACMSQMELMAAEAATGQANISIAQTCEQIALQTARYKGMIEGFQRASIAISQEYKKLIEPENTQPAEQRKRMY